MSVLEDIVHLRVLCAGQNWMSIGSLFANGMGGYYSALPAGSTIATVTGSEPASFAAEGPTLVAKGDYDFAMATPSWMLAMAHDGVGPYSEPLALRAIAAFPHDDRLLLGVRRETGISSLEDIKERQVPLRLSMPHRDQGHPAAWVIDQVLGMYGFSQDDILEWGGVILKDRPRSQNSPDSVPVDPSFDAVFDEAIMALRWQRITKEYDMRFLSIGSAELARLQQLGMPPGIIEKGRLRGVDNDVPTLDFSGWVLYCGADLPDELAYLAVRALDEQRDNISARFVGPNAAMTDALDLRRACAEVPIELHSGAAQAYADMGYLQ